MMMYDLEMCSELCTSMLVENAGCMIAKISEADPTTSSSQTLLAHSATINDSHLRRQSPLTNIISRAADQMLYEKFMSISKFHLIVKFKLKKCR
jgi:hypothetical protein